MNGIVVCVIVFIVLFCIVAAYAVHKNEALNFWANEMRQSDESLKNKKND